MGTKFPILSACPHLIPYKVRRGKDQLLGDWEKHLLTDEIIVHFTGSNQLIYFLKNLVGTHILCVQKKGKVETSVPGYHQAQLMPPHQKLLPDLSDAY